MVVKLAWFALGLVVAATAFPSFAQSDRTSTARAQAIQDCSAEAGKYSQHLWGTLGGPGLPRLYGPTRPKGIARGRDRASSGVRRIARRCAPVDGEFIITLRLASGTCPDCGGHPANTPTCCRQDHRAARGRRTASSLQTPRRLAIVTTQAPGPA